MRDTRGGTGSRDRRRWWYLFALWALALTAWAVEIPLLAGTDEASHATRAAAVVRGQPVGDARVIGENVGFAVVEVPEAYRKSGGADCFVRDPDRTPLCAPNLSGGHRLVRRPTNQYRAPPIYYAVVGLPTLVLPAAAGIYLMRIVNALLCAAFLASAVCSALELRSRPLALAGVLVATTPGVLYLGGSLNSNGLEVAAAVSLWATLLALVRAPSDPTSRLISRAGLAFVVLVLTRGLSPLFALVAVGAALCLAERDSLARLRGRRDVRRWIIAGGASLVLAGAWLVYVRLEYPLERAGSGLLHAVEQTPTFLVQAVGVFNFSFPRVFELQDIPLPWTVYAAWAVATLTLLGVALVTARRREVAVLLALLAAAFVVPVIVEGMGVPPIGVFWVGRHGLALLVGLPIVAAVIVDASTASRSRWVRRIAVVVPCLATAAQLIAFSATVRRWAVGASGSQSPLDYLLHPDWSPPLPSAVLVLLFAGGVVGLAAFAINASRDTDVCPT